MKPSTVCGDTIMDVSQHIARLVVMGTGPFAVPMLQGLFESRHEILALVTRPIEESGQRRKSPANPMRNCAEKLAIPIFDFPDVNATESVSALRDMHADLLVVCDYGQILSAASLAAARWGGINLHGSLLPRYRGAAPIAWAIYHGETVTGVSVIHMTQRLDSGPILVAEELPIDPRETAGELELRLARLGPRVVLRAIDAVLAENGQSPLGIPQDARLACSARRLRKDDGLIRWERAASQLVNQVRAFQPWPGSYTFLNKEGCEPIRFILLQTEVVPECKAAQASANAAPGEIVRAEWNDLWIQTGNGLLAIQWLQLAGRRSMQAGDFLRGSPLRKGQVLGPAIQKMPKLG